MARLAQRLTAVAAFSRSLLDAVAPIIGAVFIYIAVRWLLQTTAQFHWAAGLATAVALFIVAVVLVLGFRRKEHENLPVSVVIGMFVTTTLIAVAVFSAFSAGIYYWDPTSYRGATAVTIGMFADFYLWVLLDTLPGVKLWETFQVAPPLEYRGFWPACSLLVFRTIIVLQLFAAFGQWLRTFGPTRQSTT